MSDLFASSRAVLDHAKGHIDRVDELMQSFIKSAPYELVVEPDPLYPGRGLQFLQLCKPIPLSIACFASDAVKNLRASLDHVGFAVATAVGSTHSKNTYFPFGDTEAEARSRLNSASKDIPREIFDLMLAFKPYARGNEALYRLNKLANVNKHQSLVRAVLYATNLSFRGPGIGLDTGPRESVDGKIQVAWIIPGVQPYTELEVTVAVRFNDIGQLKFAQSVVDLLRECARVVERVILTVEAESRRIGLLK